MDIMQSPPFSVHQRLEGYNRRKAVAPPPVCVDIYVSETDERTRRDPLLPQTKREKALQQNPKTWIVSGQEKKKERKHVVHHVTQTHSPRSGLQREYKSQSGSKRAANASKRAKRCSKLFWLFFFFFFNRKAFCLFPCCKCRARLKHLLIHWSLETAVEHRLCLSHYTHNNHSETLEIDRPVTEHWDLPQIAPNEEIFAYYHVST